MNYTQKHIGTLEKVDLKGLSLVDYLREYHEVEDRILFSEDIVGWQEGLSEEYIIDWEKEEMWEINTIEIRDEDLAFLKANKERTEMFYAVDFDNEKNSLNQVLLKLMNKQKNII